VHRGFDVDGGERGYAARPRLQEGVRHPLVVRGVDEHAGAVEPGFHLRERQETGELDVAEPRGFTARALEELLLAAAGPADHDEAPVRQPGGELEEALGALAVADGAHPEDRVPL
jgi:hypothetical protein